MLPGSPAPAAAVSPAAPAAPVSPGAPAVLVSPAAPAVLVSPGAPVPVVDTPPPAVEPRRQPIFAPTLVAAIEPADEEPPVVPEPAMPLDPQVEDARRIRTRMIEASRSRRREGADLAEAVDPDLPDWYEPAPVEIPTRKRTLGRAGR